MRFADCDARAMDAPGSLNIDAVRRTTPGFARARRRDAATPRRRERHTKHATTLVGGRASPTTAARSADRNRNQNRSTVTPQTRRTQHSRTGTYEAQRRFATGRTLTGKEKPTNQHARSQARDRAA